MKVRKFQCYSYYRRLGPIKKVLEGAKMPRPGLNRVKKPFISTMEIPSMSYYIFNPFPHHITWKVLEYSLNISKASKHFVWNVQEETGSERRECCGAVKKLVRNSE